MKFHIVLAESTHNRLFPALMESLVHLLQEQIALCTYVPGEVQIAQEEHRRILQAVMLHEEQAAKQSMKRHLLHIRHVAYAPIAALRQA